MLPIIDQFDQFLGAHVLGEVDPLTRENESSAKNMESGSQTIGDKVWEKNLSAETPKTDTWLALMLLSSLVAILYAPVLGSLARQWWEDPNYGHGIFVPMIAAYLLWRDRDNWRAQPRSTSSFGFAIMLFAIGLLVLGTLGAELFTTRLSLLILICGIVAFLAGWQMLRLITFPIGYLVFMVPLPAIIYYQLTLPLQLWASQLGASGLVVLGIHTVREANLLILPNCTLNVVEACSGIRSLFSLLAAVVAYGYLTEPRTWIRVTLAVASIPIVIATNGLRLVATGVLSFFFGPAVDSGVIHLALGLGFFVLAILSALLVHKLLHLLPKNQRTAPVHP